MVARIKSMQYMTQNTARRQVEKPMRGMYEQRTKKLREEKPATGQQLLLTMNSDSEIRAHRYHGLSSLYHIP